MSKKLVAAFAICLMTYGSALSQLNVFGSSSAEYEQADLIPLTDKVSFEDRNTTTKTTTTTTTTTTRTTGGFEKDL